MIKLKSMDAIGRLGEPIDFAKWSYCQSKTVAYLMCYFNICICNLICTCGIFEYVILFSFYNNIQCILMTSPLTVSFQPLPQSLNLNYFAKWSCCQVDFEIFMCIALDLCCSQCGLRRFVLQWVVTNVEIQRVVNK